MTELGQMTELTEVYPDETGYHARVRAEVQRRTGQPQPVRGAFLCAAEYCGLTVEDAAQRALVDVQRRKDSEPAGPLSTEHSPAGSV